ncbi:MAG: hypothetical protein NUW08_03760, partial [Candidatus Uhrbacteria bacterium]|nr:hypothetical protein [Candidatus Uhrbacteria bacterium]
MPTFPFDPIAFFAAVFIVIGLANGIVRAWAAGNQGKKAIEALKRAHADGTGGRTKEEGERIMQELKTAMKAERARQKSIAERHPLVLLLSGIQTLLVLGFLGFFFHEWMWYVARDLMETDVGRLWYSAQLGFLAFTGGFVLFRLVASLSSLNTTTVGPTSPGVGARHAVPLLHVVADRRSAWHKLQKILLFLCFATVFSSIGFAVSRIVITSPFTS